MFSLQETSKNGISKLSASCKNKKEGYCRNFL